MKDRVFYKGFTPNLPEHRALSWETPRDLAARSLMACRVQGWKISRAVTREARVYTATHPRGAVARYSVEAAA